MQVEYVGGHLPAQCKMAAELSRGVERNEEAVVAGFIGLLLLMKVSRFEPDLATTSQLMGGEAERRGLLAWGSSGVEFDEPDFTEFG